MFAEWDCAQFTRLAIELLLDRTLTCSEIKEVTIDYPLDKEYSSIIGQELSIKEAYELALANGDERIKGAPRFLVNNNIACYRDLKDLSQRDIASGAVCQISWNNGGGHCGIISGIERNSTGQIQTIRVITAHSKPDNNTNQNGAYEAVYDISEIKDITIGVVNS